jgi:TolB-like protein
MSERTQRRLTAIVSADVVGYSRLVGTDETGTLAALRTHRDEFIDPTIAEHGGRIVKSMGDGLLLEFASVVDATQCAIAVQRGMTERNRDVDAERRIIWRIGINLGDIVIDGEDILGDGVNVAARLQEVAEPGGIALSSRVHEEIRDRLEAAFSDAGEHALKNITRPVRVWRWRPAAAPAAQARAPGAPLPLPDKPSIAVLPFSNMSGDPEQEYFADGIAEDIISALSKIPNLLVVARNSTFVYKGRAVDVKQVGAEQGVRCVLEGSTRKAGERIRITAQLIDAASGHHIWGERYDRKIDDIFALQDEITLKVVTELQVELLEGEMARLRTSGTGNVEAWGLQVQALACTRSVTRESYAQARVLARRAAEIDPGYASPLATLAWTQVVDGRFGWSASRDTAIAEGQALASQALALDGENPEALNTLGLAALYQGRHDDALARLKTALALSPNHADLTFFLGVAHNWNGEPETARHLIEKAMRLNPFYPAMYLGAYGFALRLAGQYDAAVTAFREYGKRQPGKGHVDLAIIYTEMGRADAARREAETLLHHQPDFTIGRWAETQLYRNPTRHAQDLAALRAAGLPE